jgi:hypothetical protein
MAAATSWLKWSNATDADFRAWVTFIINAFALWENPGDAGQIDPLTVLKPAAANTSQGYIIRRTNDGLVDMYVKVEFGSHAGSAPIPGIWLTFGTGSNGAGVITGAAATPRTQYAPGVAIYGGAPDVDGNYRCAAGWDTNRVWFAMGLGSADAQASLVASIERVHDNNGDDTATGLAVSVWHAGAFTQTHFVAPVALPLGVVHTDRVIISPNTGNGQKGGGEVYYPAQVFNPEPLPPSRNYMGYFNADVPAYTEDDVLVYGEEQNMLHLGTGRNVGWNANIALAMRYE